MSKSEDLRPAATIRIPNRQSPSQGKQTGSVRPTPDAYQGERKEHADPSERKPGQ